MPTDLHCSNIKILPWNSLPDDDYINFREPFRTMIKESVYLEEFMEYQMINAEEQKSLNPNYDISLVIKIVIEDMNFTKKFQNSFSDDYLELDLQIRNGVNYEKMNIFNN